MSRKISHRRIPTTKILKIYPQRQKAPPKKHYLIFEIKIPALFTYYQNMNIYKFKYE